MANAVQGIHAQLAGLLRTEPSDETRLREEVGMAVIRLAQGYYGAVQDQQYAMAGPRQYSSCAPIVETSIVPLAADVDSATVGSIIDKTALYFRTTAFTVPGTIGVTDSYEGVVRHRLSGGSCIDTLARLSRSYVDLVDSGHVAFLPTRADTLFVSGKLYRETRSTAPLVQQPRSLRLMPMNVGAVFTESPPDDYDSLIFERVTLPYFLGAPHDVLARVQDVETDAFVRFIRWLSRRLATLDTSDRSALTEVRWEIEDGVDKVNVAARKIGSTRFMRGVELGFFTLNLGVLIGVHSGSAAQIAGVTGSVTFLELVRSLATYRRDRIDLRASDFYLPWLISRDSSDP